MKLSVSKYIYYKDTHWKPHKFCILFFNPVEKFAIRNSTWNKWAVDENQTKQWSWQVCCMHSTWYFWIVLLLLNQWLICLVVIKFIGHWTALFLKMEKIIIFSPLSWIKQVGVCWYCIHLIKAVRVKLPWIHIYTYFWVLALI